MSNAKSAILSSRPRPTALQIIDGPSKWDLMLSLFEGNPTSRHRVSFTCQKEAETLATVLVVSITAVEQEDGSGERFNFRGYAKDFVWNGAQEGGRVEGYYSTRERYGHITFAVD